MIADIIEIALEYAGCPIYLQLKLFRLIRLKRIIQTKPLRLLNRIVDTLKFSFPTILNMLMLLLMNYLLFALIACYLFDKTQVSSEFENEIYGFRNFHVALITLFRCSTGEDWPSVMYAFGDSPGMYTSSRIFFIAFTLITAFVFLNLVQMVIVNIFDEYYFNPDNPLLMYEVAKKEFDRTWNLFTFETQGCKIKAVELPCFFTHLSEPLGFRVKEDEEFSSIERIVLFEEEFKIRRPFSSIAFTLSLKSIPIDEEGYVSYTSAFQQALKFDYGNKTVRQASYPAYKIIRMAEDDALADSLIKNQGRIKTKEKLEKLSNKKLKENRELFNPVMKLISMRIVLRVWKEYLYLYDNFTEMEGGIVSDHEIVNFINRQRKEEIKFYTVHEPTASNSLERQVSLKPKSKNHLKLLNSVYNLLMRSSLISPSPNGGRPASKNSPRRDPKTRAT